MAPDQNGGPGWGCHGTGGRWALMRLVRVGKALW